MATVLIIGEMNPNIIERLKNILHVEVICEDNIDHAYYAWLLENEGKLIEALDELGLNEPKHGKRYWFDLRERVQSVLQDQMDSSKLRLEHCRHPPKVR